MITFYKPGLRDLWFKQQMLADPDTMSYNRAWGGTISFPEKKWESWFNRWITNHENKRFYRYVTENGVFIGEAAYHLEEENRRFLADVIIHAPHRGKGYGRAALLLLCETARQNGIPVIYDEIAIDNPAIGLFLRCGFTEESRTGKSVLLKKDLTE